MARGQSYNELVAMGRERLVEAARIVHESPTRINLDEFKRVHWHRACCSAMTNAVAPELAKAHFKRLYDNGEAYYFGLPHGDRATNLRRRDKRVWALLLAAASLE